MLLRSYLQTSYGLARRKIMLLIDEGKIFINGEKVTNYKVEVGVNDEIEIPSLQIKGSIPDEHPEKKEEKPEFILFNKPKGYTCSKADPHNQIFYSLLPKEFSKYYYIGRLDKESHGLLLLTKDPGMVHKFEHPSSEITKEYLIFLNRPFNRALKNKVLSGIQEGGELLRTLHLEKSEQGGLKIVLNEGKKRHIRRIFKALGYEVTDLQRIRIGEYVLGDLKAGAWRIPNSKSK